MMGKGKDKDVESLDDRVVVLTRDRGWVFNDTGQPLTADEVQRMGRDPGLRDT